MLAVVGFGSGLIFDICVLIGFKATVDEPDIWLKIVIGCFIGVILAIFLVIIFSKIHRLRKMLKALGVENDEDAEKLLESSENISGSGEPLIFMNEEKVIDFSIMQYFNISDIMELDKKDSYELVEKEDAPSERVPVYLIKVNYRELKKNILHVARLQKQF